MSAAGFRRNATRRSRAAFALPAVALAACLIGPSPQTSSAAEPSMREFAGRLRESLSGMHTLELHYRQSVTGGERPVASDCEWLRQGDKTRLIMHPGKLPGGWWSFDGTHGYSAESAPGHPQDVRGILKTSSAPEMLTQMYSPADWLGLRLRTEPPASLPDLLAGEGARVAGAESFEGLPAYRVDLGVRERPAEGPWTWSAVLCPDRDGLPTEISCTPDERNPRFESLSKALGRVRFFVSEFRQAEDPALRRTRWVPWKMGLEIGNVVWDLEVTAVRVNPQVPASAFVPQPQVGTELIDDTVPGERKVRVHQPKAALAKRAKALAEQAAAARPPASGGAIPVASPPDPAFWSKLAMWGGALSLLGAAVFYVVRSRGAR